MYSGTTLTKFSGRIIGAHQKIDRVSRKHISPLLHGLHMRFPSAREILKFEGKNGPDGIKRKSPAQNEPWHYIKPFDADDNQLCQIIHDHHEALTVALQEGNDTKAAFEAAWLAHAIVDGLTPAHHHDYEGELEKLRGGQSKESRTTIKEKLVMHGDTAHEKLINNLRMWGPKGLMSMHGTFEMGFATLIAPLSLAYARPSVNDIHDIERFGVVEVFQRRAREVAAMDLYMLYYKKGWTPHFARVLRKRLAPIIVNTVTLAWYSAAYEAQQRARA